MDSLSIHKIQAINKYKKQQFLSSIVLYTVTAISCSLFCSSPFWYPPLRATLNVFLYVSLPKVLTLFYSSKVVFIVGNLIVIFLVGEFKIFAVPHTSEARDEGGRGQNQIFQSFSKKRANSEISLMKKIKSKCNCHQLPKATPQIKYNSCEPQQYGKFLSAGAHNYQTTPVALKPKGPNEASLRHKETALFKKGNWTQEQIDNPGRKSDGEELKTPAKDLNKMADDFIARVNRQRRLEAELYSINE